MNENLTLQNIGNGDLENQFQRLYKEITNSLIDETSKASIDIKLEFKRVKDTTSIVGITHKIKATFPPSQKYSVCQEDGDGRLLIDKPKTDKKELLKFAEGVV